MDKIEDLQGRVRELDAASLRDAVDYEAALERERVAYDAELQRRTGWSNEQITGRDADIREMHRVIAAAARLLEASDTSATERAQWLADPIVVRARTGGP